MRNIYKYLLLGSSGVLASRANESQGSRVRDRGRKAGYSKS
jgi:hypothetical protein